MGKLIGIFAVSVFSLFAFTTVVTPTVQAQQTCDDVVISNTGAGSENEISCEGVYQVIIECKNDTQIVIDVDQSSESGSAVVSENTTGGSAKSGDAVNLNEIDTVIESNNCLDEVAVVTPEEPTPPTTPETPETTPEVEGATVTSAPAVQALADTGETSPVVMGIATLAAFSGLAATAKFALNAYSKR